MSAAGLESDPSDERMEDTPRVETPAKTSGRSFAAAPEDGMPAPPDVGAAAGSSPEVGHVTSREARNLWIYPNWPMYVDCFTVTHRYARVGNAMRHIYNGIMTKFPRRVIFLFGFKTFRRCRHLRRSPSVLDDELSNSTLGSFTL